MRERKRIGLRDVHALGPGQTIYDATVAGFGARRQRGNAVTYILRYRNAQGRQRWAKIGRHGAPWTPETARAEAQQLLAEVISGKDPSGDKRAARTAMTVSDLCDQYWSDASSGRLLTRSGRSKKASTLMSDEGRIDRHIRPLLGAIAISAVTRGDIAGFLHDVAQGKTARRAKTGKPRGLSNVRGGKGAATRTLGLLSAIMTYAVDRGLRPDNPCQGVRTFAENRRDRRLSDREYAALGNALRRGETGGMWPPAIAAIKFLALTGWRSGEALGLRMADLDLSRRTARLTETKTGLSIRPLSSPACSVISSLQWVAGAHLVFAASRGKGIMSGFRSIWNRVIKLEGLPLDITPHVLRHSYASVAADLGYSDPTIAALIGHKGQSITSRYVHSADAVLVAAADRVAERISHLMAQAPIDVTPHHP